MKSTGIVRKTDELGRIVIPKEIRRSLSINECDPLEIFVDGDKVVLKPYKPGCTFCGEIQALTELRGANVCPDCIDELHKKAVIE